jgi:hypothetical protein
MIGSPLWLIRSAAISAVLDDTEKITAGLLDTLVLNPDDFPGLDPRCGEIPDIPPPPASRKRREPRNTVFDDRAETDDPSGRGLSLGYRWCVE